MNEVDNGARGDVHGAVGSYVVHALDEPELREFEAHLDGCAQCTREIAEFGEALAELSLAMETAPPPALRGSVLDAIAGVSQLPAESTDVTPIEFSAPTTASTTAPTPQAEPEPQAQPDSDVPRRAAVVSLDEVRQRRRSRALIAVAAAVALIAVAAGGWAVSLNQRLQNQQATQAVASQQSQREAELLRAPDAKIYASTLADGSQVSYVVSKQQNSAVLLAGQVGSPGAGKVYQIWAVNGFGSSDISYNRAGTFGAGGQQRVFLSGDVDSANALGVSVEPAGSTPSQPTTTPTGVAEI